MTGHGFWMLLAIAVHSPVERLPSTDSPTIARIVYHQDLTQVSNRDLTVALQELQERMESLQDSLSQSVDRHPEVDGLESEPWRNLEPSDADAAKVAEIKRNIALLKKIFAEKERRQKSATNTNDAGMASPEPSNTMRNAGDRITEWEASSELNQDSPRIVDSDRELNLPSTIPRRVLPHIVDPFELGNSLFLAGNIDQAYKFYELVPSEQMSAFDRQWLELMKACCHRRQGRFDEAEVNYRELARDKSGIRASQAAKDWLPYATARKRLFGLADEFGRKADIALQNAQKIMESVDNGNKNK